VEEGKAVRSETWLRLRKGAGRRPGIRPGSGRGMEEARNPVRLGKGARRRPGTRPGSGRGHVGGPEPGPAREEGSEEALKQARYWRG
jgi:hypothetical protein